MTIKFWGDLKDLDLRAVKKNSQTEAGGKPVFVWVACPATRDVSRLPERHPQATLFEVAFPIYPYRISRGEYRISLHPMENPQKSYRNPLVIALGYKQALESKKYPSQTALARALNVIPVECSLEKPFPEP